MSKFLSSRCCGNGGHALDREEYVKKGMNLLNWKTPKVANFKIYTPTKGFLLSFFSTDSSIKIKEMTAACGNGSAAFRLFTENPLMAGLGGRKVYTMFNVGLIQIGVKTTKIPSKPISITVCVRDSRVEKFEDSILGIMETNLGDGNGPFYFNIFPNLTMSCLDSKIFDALILDVLVDGLEGVIAAGSKPISVMVRTCYKLQNGYGSDALIESPKGKTVFYQMDDNNVCVQNVSKWDEVIEKLQIVGPTQATHT